MAAKGFVTPLHIALRQDETRSVNLLLKYQARLDYSSFNTFKDILPELIQFKNFNEYMIEQPFETYQLATMSSLKSNNMITESIVMISHHNCSYVDAHYYNNNMN